VWYGERWLRAQAIAIPIGSLLATLGLSQTKNVDWWWNSSEELSVAAEFASIGILFYTAFFAVLEAVVWSGVWLVVLGLQVWKNYEERRAKRVRELAALGVEAERQRKISGEAWEQAVERLRKDGWRPPESQD
jgi:hypothetical protein